MRNKKCRFGALYSVSFKKFFSLAPVVMISLRCREGETWYVSYTCLMRVNFLSKEGKVICWHEDVGYCTNMQRNVDSAMEVVRDKSA